MPHAAPTAPSRDPAASGKRLAERREALGLSRERLAAQVGVAGYSTVQAHEDGRNQIHADMAERYAAALQTCAAWIMFGDGDADDGAGARLLAGLADRGEHFHGFTAEVAVFHYIDRLRARVAELEAVKRRPRLEVVR